MGTKHQGAPAEVQALDSYIKLQRAAASVSNRLSHRLMADGLTESQFGVLEALLHLGPLSLCDLAAKILKSSGNLTTVVDNLERRGLVERRRDREDRRFVTVYPTAAGDELIREVFPRHAAAVVEAMGCLEPGEQEEMGRLCRKLGHGVSTRPSTAVPSRSTEDLP